jgi:hypothetical protein
MYSGMSVNILFSLLYRFPTMTNATTSPCGKPPPTLPHPAISRYRKMPFTVLRHPAPCIEILPHCQCIVLLSAQCNLCR